MIRWILAKLGGALARYLTRPVRDYQAFSVIPLDLLRVTLQPGDVLLVEGNRRISVAIKYLTQSTWSHSALYVGDALGCGEQGGEPACLVEADLVEGVRAVPLSFYADCNIRICRPFNLTPEDRQALVDFMVERIGQAYDMKNVIDLVRYLLPQPPVPRRWRRRMLELGSGDPTRAICSTLIAQAYQSIRYPVLPEVLSESVESSVKGAQAQREILRIRHHSLYTPRDFDLSPYFRVVKPTIERGFDYKRMRWDDDARPEGAGRDARTTAERAALAKGPVTASRG